MIKFNSNLFSLLKNLKEYSEETYKHSIRVAYFAMMFGMKLGLSHDEVEKLKISGLFHDIGKLKIPSSILHKRGNLTSDEYEIIKNHPLYSVELLIKNGFKDNEILSIILCHHERIDGLGYPKKISDTKIPVLSKILTICDCYDAMSSNRVYRDKQDLDYIRNEFSNNMDKQFDSYYTIQFLNFLESMMKIKAVNIKY